MKQRTILMAIVLFILIVFGMFIFAYLKQQEITEVKNDPISEQQQQDDRFDYLSRIEAKHYYIDGTHTVVGEIPMPTPCDLLESEARVSASNASEVIIDFSVINNSDTCIQQITAARFRVSSVADEKAFFKANFMEREVILNLIEANPGELPEDFEIFIKG